MCVKTTCNFEDVMLNKSIFYLCSSWLIIVCLCHNRFCFFWVSLFAAYVVFIVNLFLNSSCCSMPLNKCHKSCVLLGFSVFLFTVLGFLLSLIIPWLIVFIIIVNHLSKGFYS